MSGLNGMRSLVSGACLGGAGGVALSYVLWQPGQQQAGVPSPHSAQSSRRLPVSSSDITFQEKLSKMDTKGPNNGFLKYGVPNSGLANVIQYENHALEYDPSRKVPKWVAEHLNLEKSFSNVANRKGVNFKPDPTVPFQFSSDNKDFWNSGWSRGHMAPAGNNKNSQEAMNQTFYLTNIVPQDLDNNGNYWNRLEIYCRDLTKLYSDVYVISGPLWIPIVEEELDDAITDQSPINKESGLNLVQVGNRSPYSSGDSGVRNASNYEVPASRELLQRACLPNLRDRPPTVSTVANSAAGQSKPQVVKSRRKFVKYQVIGANNVAVPTHLFKVVLVEDPKLERPLLATFVVPNVPLQDVKLTHFEVDLEQLESFVGVKFHEQLDRSKTDRLCPIQGCRMQDYREFQQFFWKRRISSPWNIRNLDRDWQEVLRRGFGSPEMEQIYQDKRAELLVKEDMQKKPTVPVADQKPAAVSAPGGRKQPAVAG